MENKNQDIIYSYCSIETFLTIIQKKTLRLSDIYMSNDFKETIYAMDIIKPYIVDYFSKRFENNLEIDCIVTKYLNIATDSFRELISVRHAMCFSKARDKLSMWRGYANDGKGISIGFDRKGMEILFNSLKYLHLEDVRYVDKQDSRSYKKSNDLENIVAENINIAFQDKVESSDNYKIERVCNGVTVSLLCNKSMLYKNPAFYEEEEVRLYTKDENYTIHIKEFIEELQFELNKKLTSDNDINKYFSLNIDYNICNQPITIIPGYFIRNNRMVSYMDLSFNSNIGKIIFKQLIKEIIIGPGAEITKQEIFNFAQMYEINGISEGNIFFSTASYRQ